MTDAPREDLWTPRQREIARTSDPYAPKPCKIYLIITRDPWAGKPGRTGAPIVGYIGETERPPPVRWAEHEATQWWAPDILAKRVLKDEQGRDLVWPCKAAVWEAERRLVELYLPPYNREYNGSNPWLIKDGVGVHQDLPPQPDWWPKPGQVPAPPPKPPAAEAPWWVRRLRRWVLRAVGWAAAAALVWVAVLVAALTTDQVDSVRDGAGPSVVGAVAAGAAGWWVRAKVRRMRRQVRRKLRRALR